MWARFRQWLTPPKFETREDDRIAYMLYVILFTFLVAAVVVTLGGLANGKTDMVKAMTGSIVLVFAAFWLAQSGRLQLSSFIVLLTLLTAVTYLTYKGQGIHDIAIAAFPIVIFTAGILLEKRPFILMAGMTMAALAFIAVLDINGQLNTAFSGVTDYFDLISLFAILLITAIANRMLMLEFKRSLTATETNEQALRAANQELRESHERFRILSDTTPSAIYLCHNTPRFTMIYLTDAIETLTGYPKEQFLSGELSIADLFHPEDSAPPEIDEILRSQGPFRVTYRIRHASGARRWVEDIGAGVFDEAGNLLYLAGSMTDITERKAAEAALRESESRYRSLFEDSPISLWEQDFSAIKEFVDGLHQEHGANFDLNAYFQANPGALTQCARMVKILDVNRSTLAMFDAPDKETLLSRVFDLFTSQSAAAFGGELAALANGNLEYDAEVELRTLDGRPLYVIHRLVVAPGYEENWGKVFNSILDISLRKQMEAELRQYQDHLEELVTQRTKELAEAKDAAEAANRAKSAFLANMSHELRTPLNAIMGFTQLMQRDQEIPAHLQENLHIVNHSGEHLLNLINDVLEMSKIEAGQASFSRTSFDLPAMLTHLAETFRIQAEAKGLRLILEMPEDLPRFVTTDERKLGQVVANLLSNAVKFTQKGHVALRVALDKLERATAVLQFIVEDTGPGISDEQMVDIFQPFVQAAVDRASPRGTGLGLPISRQFVRLMGSELEVTGQVGHGSIFRFALQVSLALQKAQPTATHTGRVIALTPGQPEYRILVVEDRYENRILMRRLLELVGFTVREAANGAEAVEVHRLWQPHLIWMDMRMPVMNGYEATSQIRSTTQGQATTIIALTASAFEEDRAVVLSAGCDDFIRKPFRESEIFQKIGKYLGVQYEYADPPPAETAVPLPPDRLTAAALTPLPPQWLDKLHLAARRARSDQILQLLHQVEADHAILARQLAQMVEDFEFDEILRLTENNKVDHERNGQRSN